MSSQNFPTNQDEGHFDLPQEVEGRMTPVPETDSSQPETKNESNVNSSEKAPEVKTETQVKEEDDIFGNYKKLSRATKLKIGDVERPVFGAAKWTFSPYKTREDNPTGRIPIGFPSLGHVGVALNTERIKALDFRRDASAHRWATNVDNGIGLVCQDDGLFQALNREGGSWTQTPEHNGQRLTIGLARAKNHQNATLKESDALMYALNHLGLGVPAQVPLWNSGFWVSFRPCSEEAWVNFNDRLTMDKIIFGRNSSGLIFSNINALFKKRALEFAMEHLLTHNINFGADGSRDDILSLLKEPDVNHFLWGFLTACHPNGYPINRGCSANIGTCKEEISDLIFLQWLQLTDFDNLTVDQKNHMAKRQQGSVTIAEIKAYQNSLRAAQEREVVVLENSEIKLSLRLGVPTAKETIDAGDKWISGIISMVDAVLAKDATDQEREKTYNAHGRSTVMREYAHYVKSVMLNTNAVEDQNSLDMLLSEISPRADLRKAYFSEISKYIENSVVSVIGIPNYACPSCEKIQHESDNPLLTDTIPLDVCQTFFNLALLRFYEIVNR